MQASPIETHTLSNGLTVLVEPMKSVQSAAFALLVPSGSIYDPPDRLGCSSVLSDLIFRGAGNLDNQGLITALDNLGLQYSGRTGNTHITLSGSTLADKLPDALRLFGDIVRRPHLPEDEFDPARNSVVQDLRSIEDEPRQKIFIELRRRCYDAPWGLPAEGTLEGLESLTHADTVALFERAFRPNDTVLAVAGNVSPQEIVQLTEEMFGDWQLKTAPTWQTSPHGLSVDHLHQDSKQTQIGLAYNSVPYRHPDYYNAWAAVSILSGGMSARLFTEVREKRGLCYSVYATQHSLREEARVLGYAGTTVDRAQETLDVMVETLVNLRQGIEEVELSRCKARAKSAIIMQQESTARRASSLASNWYHLGRVLPMQELQQKIDALTIDSILAYVHEFPARDFTVMTIGPEPLKVPQVAA